jgi:hypothetical protein
MSSEFETVVSANKFIYQVKTFQNAVEADNVSLTVPTFREGPGYGFEENRDDADAFALAVAENFRAGAATEYGGTWTVTVTRYYGFDGSQAEPVVL